MGFIYNSKILNDEECNFIEKWILDHEDEIKSMGDDNYPLTDKDSLTGRYKVFNFLYSEVGEILLPKLRDIFDEIGLQYPLTIQCWGNIFRYQEGIGKHKHIPHSGYTKERILSATLFISGPTDIGTWYEDEKFENEVGALTIFTGDMLHHVPKNMTDKVRITMALDVAEKTRRWPRLDKQDRYYIMEENDGKTG